MANKIKPLGKRVLVTPDPREDKTAGGIIIPDTARQEKPETGTVITVGDVKSVKVGDHVLFSKYGFDEFKVGNITYYVVSEANLLAIL